MTKGILLCFRTRKNTSGHWKYAFEAVPSERMNRKISSRSGPESFALRHAKSHDIIGKKVQKLCSQRWHYKKSMKRRSRSCALRDGVRTVLSSRSSRGCDSERERSRISSRVGFWRRRVLEALVVRSICTCFHSTWLSCLPSLTPRDTCTGKHITWRLSTLSCHMAPTYSIIQNTKISLKIGIGTDITLQCAQHWSCGSTHILNTWWF